MKYNGIEIEDISLVVDGDHFTLPNDPVNTMSSSGVLDIIDAMEFMAEKCADSFGVEMDYHFVVWLKGKKTVAAMIRVTDHDLFTD